MSLIYLTLKIFILIECILLHFSFASRFPGETIPTRVEIGIGGSANITCRMNLEVFQGKDSSSLTFVEEQTGLPVPRSHIAIINETTIVYMLRNAAAQNTKYLCKSGKNGGIGVTHVSVGTAPLDVKDFKCRGYDYSYMICKFTIPENNLLTQYTLNYTTTTLNYVQRCELEIHGKEVTCKLSKVDRNYRSSYEFFKFALFGINAIGSNLQSLEINNYESVIPAYPEFKVVNITTNSANLTWRVVMFSFYAKKGLEYEVLLRPENFGWSNHTDYEVHSRGMDYSLLLRNLPYAYTKYNVSLRIRVVSRHSDDTMWSELYMQSFETLPRIPDAPPKTDNGSFFIDPNETRVRLYWQQLPNYRYNGPHFEYIIETKRNGYNIDLKPLSIDNTSAIFPWKKEHQYEFVIKSRNNVGESLESSQIIVPAWPDSYKLNSPKWIRNIYHAANRTYTLSWSAPANITNLVDYTVFWCPSKPNVLNECKGSLHFEHVNKYETKFTTAPQHRDQEHILNLAVSANYIDTNMGMHWTMCTADVTSDLENLEPEMTAISARTIQLDWSPDRVCSSLIEGYNITYCKVKRNVNITLESDKCLNENVTITVEKTAKKFILTNLTPYSTYKIEMFMFSKLKNGKSSDAKIITTKEEAPSAPRNLLCGNRTSNSAWLSWLHPEHFNGNLTSYTIVLKSKNHVMNYSVEALNGLAKLNETITFNLKDLSSFTNYTVYVTAHTVEASLPSNIINFQTLIGIPSKPLHMTAVENNRTVMHWSKPEKPSGRVEFYEVSVKVWHKDQLQKQRISTVIGTESCVINMPMCKDADYKHTLEVRAVNVASDSEIDQQIFIDNNTEDENIYEGNNELVCIATGKLQSASEFNALSLSYRGVKNRVYYKSVWEKGPFYGCAATSKLSTDTMWALGSTFILLMTLTLVYMLHDKCSKMKNIKCTLPSGLAEIGVYPTKGAADHSVLNNDIADKIIEKTPFSNFHTLHDDLPFNNEHHHLLSSMCNDSGYLGDAVAGLSSTAGISTSSNDTVDDNCANYVPNEEFTVMEQNLPTSSDAYMVMEMIKANDDRMHIDNPYVPPDASLESDLAPISISSNIGFIPTDNNYVKPNQKLNWQQTPTKSIPTTEFPIDSLSINETGYVRPDQLQKDAYERNSLINATQQNEIKPTLQAPTSPLQNVNIDIAMPPISGYVTPKELSAYFQQQRIS
ncbi:cytokine receptor-like isoform X2 [Teleopsis dalmanni]|uniref:cytokine receptor-like isoform X2 n=1 Tax=Teleopsis dalmanni TaxID=139649 RepID=UPI0018CCAD48|nr:cytokine receptor-like isoform X2 [Teleopsis dalmanni]